MCTRTGPDQPERECGTEVLVRTAIPEITRTKRVKSPQITNKHLNAGLEWEKPEKSIDNRGKSMIFRKLSESPRIKLEIWLLHREIAKINRGKLEF